MTYEENKKAILQSLHVGVTVGDLALSDDDMESIAAWLAGEGIGKADG